MDTTQSFASQRVCVISGRMAVLVTVGMLIATVLNIWIWLGPELPRWLLASLGLIDNAVVGPFVPEMTWQVRALCFLVSSVPLAILLFALQQGRGMFQDFAAGGFFRRASALRLRRIAWAVGSLALVGPVTRTLLVLVLTFNNPPGKRLLVIGLSFSDYLLAIVGGLLLAIAWGMVEATRLAEENSEFI